MTWNEKILFLMLNSKNRKEHRVTQRSQLRGIALCQFKQSSRRNLFQLTQAFLIDICRRSRISSKWLKMRKAWFLCWVQRTAKSKELRKEVKLRIPINSHSNSHPAGIFFSKQKLFLLTYVGGERISSKWLKIRKAWFLCWVQRTAKSKELRKEVKLRIPINSHSNSHPAGIFFSKHKSYCL
jgi:hypothetical protein